MKKPTYSPEERDNVFRKCIRLYGVEAQADMAVEEMSELIQALMKSRRAKTYTDKQMMRAHIVEELADVAIMMRQLEIILDCEEELEEWVNFKVMRQIQRLSADADRWLYVGLKKQEENNEAADE